MATPVAELAIHPRLVRALLAEQHPDLADRALSLVASGWDNEIYRLGPDLTVRMPRRQAAGALILHEQRWLPDLAPRLPLPIPVPLRIGVPSESLTYPWPWTVGRWLRGRPLEEAPPHDLTAAAISLGTFLASMHQPAPSDAPRNPYRGVPLADRSERFGQGVAELGTSVDGPALHRCWDQLVVTPAWKGPPVWVHGDVHPLNLLVDEGQLAAVIDFGDLTAGDPASDLAGAWTFLTAPERAAFRAAAGSLREIDDDTWARARGWALALGVAMANGDGRVATFGHRAMAAALQDP